MRADVSDRVHKRDSAFVNWAQDRVVSNESQIDMSQRGQVFDYPLNAFPVIDSYLCYVSPGGSDVVKHDGRLAFAEFLNRAVVHFRNDESETRNPPPYHQPNACRQLFRAIRSVSHDHFVAVSMTIAFNRPVYVKEKWVVQV